MSEDKFQNVHNIKLPQVKIPRLSTPNIDLGTQSLEESPLEKLNKVKSQLSITAQRMIDEILVSEEKDEFYNPKDMLLYLIVNYNGEDFIKNLNEQLTDMYKLGKCFQGKTVRLMSLILAFTSLPKS